MCLAAFGRPGRRIVAGALTLLLLGTASLQPAGAFGETRTLNLYNIHTKDSLTITYKKNGRFDDAALSRLNHFLRDWRQEREVSMDPQLFDMLWEVHREVKASGPIHVVCGFRSPTTNEMLRGRSRASGVAKTSLHMQGKAVDFSIPSANVADVRAAALRIQGGGVGYYPTSGIPFVHMDVGNVRHWPRMTRDQLVKVFPNGRTLHVPTDGEPLPGYQLALADRERGERPSARVQQPRSLIASLFGGQQDNEEAQDNAAVTTPPASGRKAPAAAPAAPAPVQVAAAVPMPQARPAAAPAPAPATFQVASASSMSLPSTIMPPMRPPMPIGKADAVAANNVVAVNDVIAERGFWQGPDAVTPAQLAAAPAHVSGAKRGSRAPLAVDPDTTAGLGPFARKDRPSDIALGYAAHNDGLAGYVENTRAVRAAPAVVTNKGAASVAMKPQAPTPGSVRSVNDPQRLNDPWLRGVMLTSSMSTGMTATQFGAPDMRTLQPLMHKPSASLVMTFAADPNPGLTADAFSGDAVVFQATVTFSTRTAALR